MNDTMESVTPLKALQKCILSGFHFLLLFDRVPWKRYRTDLRTKTHGMQQEKGLPRELEMMPIVVTRHRQQAWSFTDLARFVDDGIFVKSIKPSRT